MSEAEDTVDLSERAEKDSKGQAYGVAVADDRIAVSTGGSLSRLEAKGLLEDLRAFVDMGVVGSDSELRTCDFCESLDPDEDVHAAREEEDGGIVEICDFCLDEGWSEVLEVLD